MRLAITSRNRWPPRNEMKRFLPLPAELSDEEPMARGWMAKRLAAERAKTAT